MAIRDKLRANAAHVLRPGENVQAVFTAQTASPYWALLSYWIVMFKNTYRVVIVTDQRILVCKSGRFSTTPVNEVVGEFPAPPRSARRRVSGTSATRSGDRLYIHKRFHKDVNAADGAVAAA